MRIAVAGAGIFGISAALELRQRGNDVVVCDSGPLPHPLAESTDISKVVRMDYADEFYARLMDASFAGWRSWNEKWSEELYHEVGFLILSRDEMRPGSFEHASLSTLESLGRSVERLDAAAIAARFPAWRAGVYRAGYFNPIGGWAESGRVVEKLVAETRASGVVLCDSKVSGLDESEARVRGVVLESGARIAADAVLVAAGSWTPMLVPRLADRLWSTAQTVLHFHTDDVASFRPPHFPVWAGAIGAEGWYGFPALEDGRVKVANHGAGRRVDPDDGREVLAADEERCRSFLRDALPALAEAPIVGRRVCLYSDSFDGDFLVDRDPEHENLFVATGGSGHGFKFAPSLGGIIADVVEGKQNRWAPRFRWRERGSASGARK